MQRMLSMKIIDETLAQQTWPGQDPIGLSLEFGNMDGYLQLLTIVGIVDDILEFLPAMTTKVRERSHV